MTRPRVLACCALLLAFVAGCSRSNEPRLRAEFEKWKLTPYAENGTSLKGISNAAFVREMFHNTFGVDIPTTRDEQYHTGKLVERAALKPGDLVFFEGAGFGPFKSKSVGIFMGSGEVAIAKRELGVTLVKLDTLPWKSTFKTGRHISTDPKAGPPVFDAAKYGSNRGALLRDIAVAWSGTLYLDNGKTFDGIGNYEFVASVYEGIYDAELEGTPSNWAHMGEAVKKDSLEPGDIILYQAVGIGGAFGRQHAGMYIGDGEFTHCVKGLAVTISRLDDPKWSAAYRAARRIDPDKQAALRAAAGARSADIKVDVPNAPKTVASSDAGAGKGNNNATGADINATVVVPVAATPPRTYSEMETKLRSATASWRGTPYKIGGTTKAGVDCSAFVRAAYKEALAIDLPRTSTEQELLGTPVARAELQSGDLVFFRTQGMGPFFKSRHVGVYLGGGEFAQSSGSKGVTISRLDQYYWNKKYHTARRVAAR